MAEESTVLDPYDLELNESELISLLLDREWHERCDIIYGNELAGATRDMVVRYKTNESYRKHMFLNYSKGPKHDYYWDVHGSNFNTPELAIYALAQAPYPESEPL